MADYNTTTAAPSATALKAFEARARADGFLNDEGFFIGPPDEDCIETQALKALEPARAY